MRFVIAGSSGFLGTALRERLARDGHEVIRLVRGEPPSSSASRWDPTSGQVDRSVIESADVVVNLAGSPIVRPWTARRRDSIMSSRVLTTRTLATAIAASTDPPVLVAQSGTDAYGAGYGDTVLTEDMPRRGDTFLARVVEESESATEPARAAGARVCHLRSGVVLDRRSETLKIMLPFFWIGVAGRVGDGRQYFPVISLRDWLDAVLHLVHNETSAGPYNLTLPDPPTNAEFTKALGAALHRPTVTVLPASLVRFGAGDLSMMLLNSARAVPRRLLDKGFTFADPTVEDAIASALA
jgi:uncharacterized protein